MPAKTRLTVKQIRFIEVYLIDFIATQAAIRAGYNKKTAYATGAENLRKPQIEKAIKERLLKLSEKAEYDATQWRKELIQLKDQFLRQRLVVNDKGEPIRGPDGNLIQVSADPDRAIKVLELLGKHMGLFIEKKQIDVTLADRSDWLAEALKDVNTEDDE